MLGSLVAGVILGLSLAAPPGPMNAIIADESVSGGWRAGFLAGVGAMASDVCFFVLAAVGAVTILESAPTIRSIMLVVGGGLMLWFGIDALRHRATIQQGSPNLDTRGFRRAFVLGLTNPYQILWWIAVGVAFLTPDGFELGTGLPGFDGTLFVVSGGPPLVAGLFLGIFLWILAFPTALVYAEDRVTGFGPTVALASGLVLLGFGVVFLTSGLGAVLSSG